MVGNQAVRGKIRRIASYAMVSSHIDYDARLHVWDGVAAWVLPILPTTGWEKEW